MRLSVEWIKEWAPVDAGPDELADTLTMAGLEVEETAASEVGPVLDIKVTPNRGDCLSVVGVAREVAAASGVPLKQSDTPASTGPGRVPQWTSVRIDAPDLCPRYAARIVRNVRLGESPEWMRQRLLAAGMRPLNNLVDVTNYVMLETGQPLHAFDYDTLEERRIVVRRAREDETITTLDGVERELSTDMLVIADAEKPVAVAGVMGGAETEITAATRTMLLESAHFTPRTIRRTARALSHRTEASYRFERTVDPDGVVAAADRACELIAQLSIGEVEPGVIDVCPEPAAVRTIAVRPERVEEMLGFAVEPAVIAESLQRLGLQPVGDGLEFAVPARRPDLVREIDLIEEVGRVVGYDSIPRRLPVGSSTQGGDSPAAAFATRMRHLLAGLGLQEVLTHSLLAPGPFEDPRDADERIAIRSALSAELSGLRRSLIPGAIDAIERNARRGQGPLCFFEIGSVFHRVDGVIVERPSIAGAMAGAAAASWWRRDGAPAPADFFAARGMVERVVEASGAEGLDVRPGDDPRLHPGRRAGVWLGDRRIGVVGEIAPALAADLTVRDRIVVFELELDALRLAEAGVRRFVAPSVYPGVARDLAPRVARSVPFARVRDAVASAGCAILERCDLVDVYTGAPLPDDLQSLTLKLVFRAPDRTLAEADVTAALDVIRAALEAQCAASFAG